METMNGSKFKDMLENGAINLSNHYQEIDALNVFPVPDGDTGTNMSMTFNAGVKEALNSNDTSLEGIAKVLSNGLLMGARGNSGVILSQIFRGLYQGLEGKTEINGLELAEAFVKGSRVAYKAVMRPVEGTILTVIREAADYTLAFANAKENITINEVIDKLVFEAEESLKRTPELLPVLAEVGVVDSGGAGLVCVLKGFQLYLNGVKLQRVQADDSKSMAATQVESEEFGYCTEFIIRLSEKGLTNFNEEALKKSLSRIGNSLVVVQDEDIVKVHVHTLTPGEALNMGQRYGEFVKLKIENMSEQHENILVGNNETSQKPAQDYAIIAVAAGEGLSELFKSVRCDIVISGGQTMNPSTEDFVSAIQSLNAKQVFILPNNSNIILAAQQAESICATDEMEVTVLPSKSIPQGYAACLNFNPEADAETNYGAMMEGIQSIQTGQVTFAIKDTVYEGLEIHANDFMGIKEKDIVVAVPDKLEATRLLLANMINEESELVTIFTGEDVTEEEINVIEEYVGSVFPSVELEVIEGNQPVYSFIIGIE